MKTFVINLAREPEKRTYISKECAKYNLDVDIIDAIDGKTLSKDFIKNNVYDYPNCHLTLSEIGCALSHIKIYEKIVKENIQLALILEDDSILSEKIPHFLSSIEKNDKSSIANIYLLTADNEYILNKKIHFDDFILFKIRFAIRANGYILNLKSAKILLDFLYPIRYEADMWGYFSIAKSINIYTTIPYLISSNDLNKNNSSIEEKRRNLIQLREKYRKNLFENKESRPRIKQLFWRLFLRKKEKTQWNQY